MTTQLSIRKLKWSMDDHSAEQLFKLAQHHVSLAKEAIKHDTPLERKKAIQANIDTIRIERDNLIKQFQSNLRGIAHEQN